MLRMYTKKSLFVPVVVGVCIYIVSSLMTQRSEFFGAQCTQLKNWVPGFTRLIAIGDIHGDSVALLQILMAAGVSDASCNWTGEVGARVIQMGDLVDRGPDSEGATMCLDTLQKSATSPDNVIRLTGNHELLWLEGNYRFASRSDTPAVRKRLVDKLFLDIISGAVRGAYTIGPLLFTHAGFRPKMLDNLYSYANVHTASELASVVNTELTRVISSCQISKKCRFDNELFSAGSDRGGRGIGGPFWTDYSILTQASAHRLPDGIVQIVGHSAAHCSTRQRSDCQPIRHRPDLAAIVVDAGISKAYASNRAYLEILPPSLPVDSASLLGTRILTRVLDGNGIWRTQDLTHQVCSTRK